MLTESAQIASAQSIRVGRYLPSSNLLSLPGLEINSKQNVSRKNFELL